MREGEPAPKAFALLSVLKIAITAVRFSLKLLDTVYRLAARAPTAVIGTQGGPQHTAAGTHQVERVRLSARC